MKSILIAIVTCLIIPCAPFSVQANENKKVISTSSPKDSQTKTESEQGENLDFSSTGRPGQQTAGESRSACSTENSLQAVIPTSHSGKTTSGHPRFWVYLTTVSNNIDRLEFVLQNEARQDVWRSQLKNKAKSGYQSVSLPSTEPTLATGEWYRWYVKAYCKSQAISSHYVQGWVYRVPLTSKLQTDLQQNMQKPYTVYSKHGIWYDAVNHLLSSNSSNLVLEQNWQNVMEAGGLCSQQLPYIKQSAINN